MIFVELKRSMAVSKSIYTSQTVNFLFTLLGVVSNSKIFALVFQWPSKCSPEYLWLLQHELILGAIGSISAVFPNLWPHGQNGPWQI